jgi:uncharacterized PurR-regulated membrane protein YhhQ (DUF165 family)
MNSILVVFYLGAIVLANLIVGKYGFNGLLFTSFVLIPFDLFARDILHDKWNGHYLKVKMAALILSGSVLSYAINSDLQKIAIASFVAFALAGIIDTIAYQVMSDYVPSARMNISNAFSSFVDSLAFHSIVFGFDMLSIMQQAYIKFIGGIIWVALYVRYWRKYVVQY